MDEITPSMTYENFIKYLGVNITPMGEVELPRKRWDEWVVNLMRALMKSEQTCKALKMTILLRTQHQLRLAQLGIGKLKRITTWVRKTLKKFLHLPEWTPNAWIHHKAGRDLRETTEAIIKCRKKSSERMLLSKDRIAAEVAREVDETNEQLTRRFRMQHIPLQDWGKTKQKEREGELEKVKNGKSLKTMLQSHVKRTWLWYGKTL